MELKVKVEQVYYPKEITDNPGLLWYIIKTNMGIIKGMVAWRPESGQQLKLDGNWTARQGQKEFSFRGATLDIPVMPRDQLRYVAEQTPGIGTAIESQIWDIWGEDWQEQAAPNVITRLSGELYENFRQSIYCFTLEKEKSEAIAWLMGKGATLGMSASAWDRWEKLTISRVTNNCYELTNLKNYGFTNVDESIRHQFGITDEDPRRIKAAVVYAMKQKTQDGSTITTWLELLDECTLIMQGMYATLISACVTEMFSSGVLRSFQETQSIALGSDYKNELSILEFIQNEC